MMIGAEVLATAHSRGDVRALANRSGKLDSSSAGLSGRFVSTLVSPRNRTPGRAAMGDRKSGTPRAFLSGVSARAGSLVRLLGEDSGGSLPEDARPTEGCVARFTDVSSADINRRAARV